MWKVIADASNPATGESFVLSYNDDAGTFRLTLGLNTLEFPDAVFIALAAGALNATGLMSVQTNRAVSKALKDAGNTIAPAKTLRTN